MAGDEQRQRGRSRRSRPPLPLTNAELIAFRWGERMAREDVPGALDLVDYRREPTDLLDEFELAAWRRLGKEEFFRWAVAGQRAALESEEGV